MTRSHRALPLVIGAALIAVAGTAGAAAWSGRDGRAGVAVAEVARTTVAVPRLVAISPPGPRKAVPWDAPLTLATSNGTLGSLVVLDPDGQELPGRAVGATRWASTATSLLPAATYRVTAAVVDGNGQSRPVTLAVRTTRATHVIKATLSPGDDAVVGVGQPVIVRLNDPVKEPADRAAVVGRLAVTSTPAVAGAWRWMADDELHYRGPTYWPAGTRVDVVVDLHRLKLSDGTWGSGRRTTSYRVGDAVISTVDVRAHTMTVRKNGKVLRTLKVSTGRPEFETHNGVHLVLEKVKLKTMDSSTIGIPRGGPGGYYLKVPNSVRISYSGEFVHSAPGTVRQQGVANVSHGCINLAPADAAWFYALAKRGDVVDVKGSPRKPLSYDPGTSDWNMPFSAWAS